jgi:hypothetical protein
METIKIEKFIDGIILGKLSKEGYDGARQHLYTNILNYKDIVKQNLTNSEFKFNSENIEKLNGRTKYLAYYVFYGQKRVIDLFTIENRIRKFSPPKAFKALIFKERLKGKD